jgi:hypothetical protein
MKTKPVVEGCALGTMTEHGARLQMLCVLAAPTIAEDMRGDDEVVHASVAMLQRLESALLESEEK